MAGLLGQGWDDPRSQAIMALSGGLLQGNLGAGLLGANQAITDAKSNAAKQKFMDMQMQNMQSEIEARKLKTIQDQRQQQLVQSFLHGGEQPGAVPGAAGGVPGAPAAPGGAATPGAPGAPNAFAAGTPGGQAVMGLAKQLGIPPEAIQADIIFNGGKKISEMLAARSKPEWQNVNGNLVNTNAPGFQGGFQPGVNVSNDGRATMWQPDGKGGLVVGAPPGAMDTYRAYQGVSEGVRADHDVTTVTPANQPPQMTTRGALVRNPMVQGRITPAQQAAMDTDRGAILQQELTKAKAQLQSALQTGDQSAAARAQTDIAALNREIGGRSASVGMPLQSEEDKLRTTEGVKGDVKANEARSKDVLTAKKFLSIADQAEQVLKSGPTASGFGRAVDSAAAFVGQSTKGAEAAQQLKALGGWLVANVPRMEGPQSNFDVANYQVQAADVANDSLPVERRMAALTTIKQMMQNTVDGGATGSFGPKEAPKGLPQPMKGMTRNGYRFKGGDPSKQENWERM